jgi:hypothetical protein
LCPTGRRVITSPTEPVQVARDLHISPYASLHHKVYADRRPRPELMAARAEIVRLSEALTEMGVRVMLVEGKGVGTERSGCLGGSTRRSRRACWICSTEPSKGGWDHRAACRLLEVNDTRAWCWPPAGRSRGRLEDRPAGGTPVHGLLAWRAEEIVRLFEQCGEVDRWQRKLAQRGSSLGRVWLSPSSVRRVLAAHGLRLRRPKRPWEVAAAAVPAVGDLHAQQHLDR